MFFVLISIGFFNAAIGQYKKTNDKELLAKVEKLSTEGSVLFDHQLYEQAYPVLKEVITLNVPIRYTIPEMYVKTMYAIKRYDEALMEIKKMIVLGTASPFVTDTLFKECYVGRNGNDKGFMKMKEATIGQWKQAVKDSVQKDLINREAPAFILKDGAGNSVSLASLKGKTVVLDFWATWCGPCKASFPAMQQLKARYKADTNVVFLFIHAFERKPDPVPAAVSYMENNKYDFKLLFDLRDPATKECAVAKSFGVKAIPSKYVIDPAGNIRFISTGGVGITTNAHVIEHLSAMIELAAKSKI